MLPFQTQSIIRQKITAAGIAIPKADGVYLVVHEGEIPTNVLDARTQTVPIPWINLADIVVRQGILSDTVILRLHAALTVPGFPDTGGHEIKLSIQKRDRDQIELFLKEVEAFQSGTKRESDVDDMIDDIEDFLKIVKLAIKLIPRQIVQDI